MNELISPTRFASSETLALGHRLQDEVLSPVKQSFVGKDEIVDLMGVCLVARENLFLLGPPGTAKSALVHALADQIEGEVFDYLLTRFTEPNEIFGPFDIRKLRDGDLITNTEGMLPEASFVFLDELLNANSAILNSLLMVLNERVFRRGRETRSLPTLIVIGASNRLPEDDALNALFDRFLLRVTCDNVGDDHLGQVLEAGWNLERTSSSAREKFHVDDVRKLQGLLEHADFSAVREQYIRMIHRLRLAGVAVSDRRAVKLQRMLAASALLCGRIQVDQTDMWVLRYIWDREEQQDVLKTIVGEVLEAATDAEKETSHPQSCVSDIPDPEQVAGDLDRIEERAGQDDLNDTTRAQLLDQLGVLASRCQWIEAEQSRQFLEGRINDLIASLGSKP